MKISLSQLGNRTEEPPISWLLKVVVDNPNLISLAAGFTDSQTLPVEETKALVNSVLSSRCARKSLQYGATEGERMLRELTARRLRALDNSEGIAYSPENIVITNGSQQFLYLIVEALCDPGDIVIVEAPTYFVFLGIIQSLGVVAKNIPMREDGLDVEYLKSVLESLKKSGDLRRVKFLYSITYFQNPTSWTTATEKKIEILDILRSYEKSAGHTIFYLEDAAYRELRFSGLDNASSLTFQKHFSRVIYTSTFSKPFATGIRVGYCVLPKELFRTIYRIKGNHDFGTSSFLQNIIVEALKTGVYDKHLKHIVERYSRKAEMMDKALKEHFDFPNSYRKPCGGLYFWVSLISNSKAKTGFKSKIFQQSLKKSVIYVPGNICYANDTSFKIPDNEMRISFGYAGEKEIVKGIERLSEAIKIALGK